jgi:hypothetical protein
MKALNYSLLKKMLIGIALSLVMISAYGYEIGITVAPNVLNIGSQGNVVTVHTDIAYSTVNAHTVYLNGVQIKSWKADDQGNFVAKFWMSEIKALEELRIGDYNVLTLTGFTYDLVQFIGTDDILVIDNVPSGSGS